MLTVKVVKQLRSCTNFLILFVAFHFLFVDSDSLRGRYPEPTAHQPHGDGRVPLHRHQRRAPLRVQANHR